MKILARLALFAALLLLTLLLALTGTAAACLTLLPGNRTDQYRLNQFIALDQQGNAQLAGDPDETLSSRLGKAARAGRCPACRWLCRLLDRIHPMHCERSREEDEGNDEVLGL